MGIKRVAITSINMLLVYRRENWLDNTSSLLVALYHTAITKKKENICIMGNENVFQVYV